MYQLHSPRTCPPNRGKAWWAGALPWGVTLRHHFGMLREDSFSLNFGAQNLSATAGASSRAEPVRSGTTTSEERRPRPVF